MAKQMAVRFEDDEYFSEPDYDNYTDEELDELYDFGEIRSTPTIRKAKKNKRLLKRAGSPYFSEEDDYLLDLDLNDDDTIYDIEG